MTLPDGALTGNGAPVKLAPCGGLVINQRWARIPKGTRVAGGAAYLPETSKSTVASRCSPMFTYDVTHATAANAAWVNRVTNETSFVNAVRGVYGAVCELLYKDVGDIPDERLVNIVMTQKLGAAAYVAGVPSYPTKSYVIDLGAFVSKPSIDDVITLTKHEGCYVWQWGGAPSWVAEGLADFVRFRIGGSTYSSRSHGGSYTDGYNATGFFFDWIDRTWPGSIRAMNIEMGVSQRAQTPWQILDWFTRTTGKNVDALWTQYQKSF
jgi:hypothetical protein